MKNLRNICRIVAASGLAVGLGACLRGPQFLTQSTSNLDHKSVKIAAAITSDDGAAVVSELKAGGTETQVVRASEGSGIAGTEITFPPGSIGVDMSITLEEGASIASEVGSELAAGATLDPVGNAVVVVSSAEVDPPAPFIISLQIDGTALNLLTDGSLAVVYKTVHYAAGKVYSGILPLSSIVINGTSASFETRFFGAFQLVRTDLEISAPIERESAKPIVTKREETASVATATETPPNAAFTIESGNPNFVSKTAVKLVPVDFAGVHMLRAANQADCSTVAWVAYAGGEIVHELVSGDGNKTVCLQARSAAGAESAVATDTVQLDRTPPDTISPAIAARGPSTGLVTGTATDGAGTGVVRVEFQIEDAAGNCFRNLDGLWAACSTVVWEFAQGTTTWQFGLPQSSLVTTMAYKIKARAIDAAGNVDATPIISPFEWAGGTPATLTIPATDCNAQVRKVGPAASLSVRIMYSGSIAASGIAPTVNGDFAFMGGSYPGSGGTCGPSIGSNCSVVLSFLPTAVDDYSGTLSLNYNDGTGTQRSATCSLTGQGGIVIGQPGFDVAPSHLKGMYAPTAVHSDGTHLAVADHLNHRVLFWSSLPTAFDPAPDFVLGQPDFYTRDILNGGPTTGLNRPIHVFIAGTKLLVTDYFGHRVLIWNSFPTANHQPPDVVVGQANLTSTGSGLASDRLSYPTAAVVVGAKLLVADYYNNRVLVWNSVPTSDGAAADFALGQPDLTNNTPNNGGIGADSLFQPMGLHAFGTKLFVADTGNNRVLIWNTMPSVSGDPASLVLGQTDMFGAAPNGGGRTAQTLAYPDSVYSDGTRLVVADTGNNRVLIWNPIPSADQQGADVIVGQAGETTGTPNATGLGSSSLCEPHSPAVVGGKLYVADRCNNRVLQWSTVPTSNVAASLVLGQAAFDTALGLNAGPSGQSLADPNAVVDGTRLTVADPINNRVLIWNAVPTGGANPDVVIGQPSRDAGHVNLSSGGPTPGSLNAPSSAHWNGTTLFVADKWNNRVLFWTSPTGFQQTASGVLGQANLNSDTVGTTGALMYQPHAVATCSGKTFVTDTKNNRIMVWVGSIPPTSSSSATFVLGQADLVSGLANRGASAAANGLNNPTGIYCSGSKLFVADTGNNRVLIWNTIPGGSAAADVAVGQGNLTSNSDDGSSANPDSLSGPEGVFFDGTRLYVADTKNNRVVVWDTVPVANGDPADHVLGQPDSTSSAPGLAVDRLRAPRSVSANGAAIFVGDSGNGRILSFPNP